MSREEGQQILQDAERAGADYANDQVDSDYFRDWVFDQLLEAEQMRRRDPASVLPLETPAHARKIARNMLQTLKWDIQRQLDRREMLDLAGAAGVFSAGSRDWVRDTYGITEQDVGREFFSGFDEALHKPAVMSWLTDLILETSEQVRGTAVREAGSGLRSRGLDRERRDLIDVLAQRGSVHPEMAAQLADRYQRLGVGPAELRRRMDAGETPIEIAQMRERRPSTHRRGARESGPMPGWDQPAPKWAARVVITPGDPRRRTPWTAKVYDSAGHVRSHVNHHDPEYVEKWVEMYFPGVPVERQQPPAAAPARPRRSRRSR